MILDADIAALIGAGTSVLSFVCGQAVMKEKIRRLEKDYEETQKEIKDTQSALKLEQSKFVTYQHFDAVVLPFVKTLDNVQSDIKLLLRLAAEKKN